MTTTPRLFATEIAGYFHGDDDRAWTCHHHCGQMTIAGYRRLDKVEPCEITGIARVRTTAWPEEVFEYLGTDAGGWFVRAELEVARYEIGALQKRWLQYRALPYLRLVDEVTGYSFPDLLAAQHAHSRPRVHWWQMSRHWTPLTHCTARTNRTTNPPPTTEEEGSPMTAPTLIPDDYPDPVNRARGIDLAGAGLPGYCPAVTIGADRQEHLALLRYNAGPADYWPRDWSLIARTSWSACPSTEKLTDMTDTTHFPGAMDRLPYIPSLHRPRRGGSTRTATSVITRTPRQQRRTPSVGTATAAGSAAS